MAEKPGTTALPNRRRHRLLYPVAFAGLLFSTGCNPIDGSSGQVLLGGSSEFLKAASAESETLPTHAEISVGSVKDGRRTVGISLPANAEAVEVIVAEEGRAVVVAPFERDGSITLDDLVSGRYSVQVSWETGATVQGEVALSGASMSASELFDHDTGDVLSIEG